MSDPSPGVDAGVWRTPIVVDDRGRRRNANGDVQKFPGVHDDPTREQARAVAALKAAFDAYVKANDARTVTGGGSAFSGNFGSGLIYNPNAAGANNGSGDGGGSGTADNPYVMGTNSSTAANPLVPQDDSWTLAEGPSNDAGGPYDGVVLAQAVRYALDGSTTVTKTAVQDGGGTIGISVTTVRAFERRLTWDSDGALFEISAEEEIDSAAETTVTQLS